MIVMGIDPGKSGGIAVIADGQAEAWKMPDTERDILDLIASTGAELAVMEKVGATPQMGVVSAFQFGYSSGVLRAAVLAARVRLELVAPSTWQRAFGLVVRGRRLAKGDTAKKNRNKARAQEMFPGLKITHATADALLLAEYGRRLGR